MPQLDLDTRKRAEADLHDYLRGTLGDDPQRLANKKFYAIAASNEAYVRRWLGERCQGKRVLDYCCGAGSWTMWLAEAGAEAVGIDISPQSIEIAKREAARRGLSHKARFHVMDAEAMEFEDSWFDFAVINGVLHHLDLGRAYRELARILRPEGRAIATEALRHNIFIHLYRKLTPHLRSAWEVEHILGRQEILAARQYFEEVEVMKFFHLATLAAVPFRNTGVFEPLRKGLEAVDSVILRLPLLRWQAWMAVFVCAQPRKPFCSGSTSRAKAGV